MATINERSGLSPPFPGNSVSRKRTKAYVWLAIACAIVAIGGFMPTYWLQLPPRTFIGPPLLHMHGVVSTAWVLFLISQTWLVSENRIRHHRSWGLGGIALATMVVVLGIAAAINSLEAGLARGLGDDVRAFFITPMSAIFRFALFTGAAIVCVHRPQWHKRFMIVGTVALIEAAGARFGILLAMGSAPGMRPGLGPPPPDIMPVVVGMLLQLILVAGMVYDRKTHGKVHPAWIVGSIVSVAIILVKVPISRTSPWLEFAQWATTIAG